MVPENNVSRSEAVGHLVIGTTSNQSGTLIANLLAQDGYSTDVLLLDRCTPGRVAQFKPDLVLLYEGAIPAATMSCCAHLRAVPDTSDLPIVVVSSCFRRDSRAQWVTLGADDYLCALFDSTVLSARVAALVARYRRRAADLECRRKALGLLSAMAAQSPTLANYLARTGLAEPSHAGACAGKLI